MHILTSDKLTKNQLSMLLRDLGILLPYIATAQEAAAESVSYLSQNTGGIIWYLIALYWYFS